MNALLGFPSAPSAMTRSAGPSRRTALVVAAALAAATLAGTVARAPAAGAAPPNVTALALGWNHSCALTSTGGVKCWGANHVGQLGDGTTSDRAAPVDVVGLTSGVVAISAGGNRTCALTSAGGVKCWGGNSTGAIGDGTAIDRSTPTDVVGITSGASAIAAGAFHTCAVVAGGAIKCWGGNDFGELGNGTAEFSLTPVSVVGLSGVTAITAGGRQTCAITSIGGAKCWGHNQSGQLGDGSGFSQRTPVDVSGLTSGVAHISAGGRHTCAVTSSGGAKCWGQGDFGQVGDGGLGNRITPVDVLGLTSGVLRVAAGRWQTCAITSGGGVMCWGPIDGTGDVGDDKQPNPQAVPGLSSGVVALAMGEGHACAAMSAGGVKCFGNNHSGKLGDGTRTPSLTPVDVLFEGVPAVTSTSASLSSSPNPSNLGQSVTFTVRVTSASGSGTPTGMVSFEEGNVYLGGAMLSGGTATFTTSSLYTGTHRVVASYPGDATFNASTAALTHAVTSTSAVGTTTSLTASPNPSISGQTVTFTATVTPASGSTTPTGVVNFKEGATTLGTGTLSGGSATFATSSLSAGTHTITASYAGNSNFTGSTSPAVTQTVSTASTDRVASISDVTVTEPDDGFVLATFTITLSRGAGRGKVTVLLNTADGTATAPKDYTAKTGTTVTFDYGQSVRTVAVSVKGDLRTEPNETFTVNLSSPTNATIGDPQGIGTILNDD